jgi:DNA-binding transcriptional MocR family regulator
MVAPLMAEIAALWIDDGTADRVVERKRTESAARQRLAREILSGIPYRAHPNGYHLWIELPEGWKSAELVAEAHRRGVAVTPAESFAVGETPVPAAVRACLGAARDRRDVRTALTVLAGILRSDSGLGSAIV